ncbi:hypothetical protein KsCSTR_22440 [Candidatus Kuenenia stuttgartiensis]|jgi:hypothetical protein|uniref:Uncharacterized protein n=1 Tax=Kuenenia stuttgartiensis TaxID=174633 RepID=A0A2C9C9Z6_KUEST|nr:MULTISPECIES: hypothetical protein [Kuenenia]MCZ7623091.1 hypothetical protein [Candidatus Kuenenia sp.]QII11623.1 hypothetical protein KsCSTR_22440 [Candidatus Kuenenia stuttgartiensis]SOH02679.1 hypothetical protein KSMBR1_0159 [Candidatus Kuenenia stuttgartiensis]
MKAKISVIDDEESIQSIPSGNFSQMKGMTLILLRIIRMRCQL